MPGEDDQRPSRFTVDTLHHFLQREIDDLRKMLDERYATQNGATKAAFEAQQTAMTTAFAAADKAVDKALAAAEKAVEQRANTLDREFHEHLEQVRHENALAFNNSEKAVGAALAAQEKAVGKAEIATEKRFESVNEFRGQLNDQAQLFLPRSEYAANHQNLADRVTDLTDRINRNEGSRAGYAAVYGWLIAGFGVIVAVAVVANALFGGK